MILISVDGNLEEWMYHPSMIRKSRYEHFSYDHYESYHD